MQIIRFRSSVLFTTKNTNLYFLLYFSTPIDVKDRSQMMNIVQSCIGTKFLKKWYGYDIKSFHLFEIVQ